MLNDGGESVAQQCHALPKVVGETQEEQSDGKEKLLNGLLARLRESL